MNRIFANPDQLEDWVKAAGGIREKFGTRKALDYLIGGKFYGLAAVLHSAGRIVRTIDEERKKPDFRPIQVTRYEDGEVAIDLDETYKNEKANVVEAEALLVEFVSLIRQTFPEDEIRKYFHSDPRLGLHVFTKKEYEFLVMHGAAERTIETEIEDALIFADMMKYFGI